MCLLAGQGLKGVSEGSAEKAAGLWLARELLESLLPRDFLLVLPDRRELLQDLSPRGEAVTRDDASYE